MIVQFIPYTGGYYRADTILSVSPIITSGGTYFRVELNHSNPVWCGHNAFIVNAKDIIPDIENHTQEELFDMLDAHRQDCVKEWKEALKQIGINKSKN